MQTGTEVGKYVTDGKHVYPYNAFLDDLLANGTLRYCEKPAPREVARTATDVIQRSPVTMTPEERTALAEALGITLGELTNMSPQELQNAEAELANKAALTQGFPTS